MTTPDLIVTGLELFSRTAALKNIIAFTVTARTIRNRAAQIRGRHPYGRQRSSVFGTPSQLMFWKYLQQNGKNNVFHERIETPIKFWLIVNISLNINNILKYDQSIIQIIHIFNVYGNLIYWYNAICMYVFVLHTVY